MQVRVRTTLSFSKNLWKEYKRICKVLGHIPSWRIEKFMESEIILKQRQIIHDGFNR